MKKSLLALAVLASAAGAAQAASSVTLYGRIDVGYEKFSNSGFKQTGNEDSRIGIKGQEDLGNGLAAIFQFEGRLNADSGSYETSRFFHRESWVGLKGNFGTVRFGRSKGAMERALGDYNPGERVSTIWDNYNSGLGRTLARVDNSAFYDYDMGGLNVGASVTTKGGADDFATDVFGNQLEGSKGSKMGWGAHASYAGKITNTIGYSVAAAYQKDGTTNNGREWGVGTQVNFAPVSIGGSYADYKNKDWDSYKARTWGAYITANVTANDALYAKYMNKREKTATFGVISKQDMFALGYSHALSKRTSVYTDVARYRDRLNGGTTTGYDIAVRHAF